MNMLSVSGASLSAVLGPNQLKAGWMSRSSPATKRTSKVHFIPLLTKEPPHHTSPPNPRSPRQPPTPDTGVTIEDTLSIHWTNRLQQERKKDGPSNSSIFLFDFDDLLLPEPFSFFLFFPFFFFLPVQCSLLQYKDILSPKWKAAPLSLHQRSLSKHTLKHFMFNGSLDFLTGTCPKFDVFLHVSDVGNTLTLRLQPSSLRSAVSSPFNSSCPLMPSLSTGISAEFADSITLQDQSVILHNASYYH